MMAFYKKGMSDYLDKVRAKDGGSKGFNKFLTAMSKEEMDKIMKPFTL